MKSLNQSLIWSSNIVNPECTRWNTIFLIANRNSFDKEQKEAIQRKLTDYLKNYEVFLKEFFVINTPPITFYVHAYLDFV